MGPAKGAVLQGEAVADYFVLTNEDQPQDLRVQADANAKLQIPLTKYLTIAPFVDFYAFELKLQPVWGMNLMTGISIGFSRVWKPQYERF